MLFRVARSTTCRCASPTSVAADDRGPGHPRRAGRVYPSPGKAARARLRFPSAGLSRRRRRHPPGAGEVHDRRVARPRVHLAARAARGRRRRARARRSQLERWIDLPARGWYSGDHHVHSAGCPHYETPTQGVEPDDMIRHILGEALSVGSVLTWGPGYYYQKQFFEARDHTLSTPDHLMRYDLEVSGFPSSHAGHLVLLRPQGPGLSRHEDASRTGRRGTCRSCTGRRHRAPSSASRTPDGGCRSKVTSCPPTRCPPFDGIGANEYIVDVAHDAVDFISTVDTPPCGS